MLHLLTRRKSPSRSLAWIETMHRGQMEGALKILQLNMHRGKVANDLLSQIVIEQKADIAIISEQYKRRTSGLWFEDSTQTSAIWIPNSADIRPAEHGGGNGFVWIRFKEITLVSCYLTPSDDIREFQRKLDGIEDAIRDVEGVLVVAGDFNSRAVEWGMRTTNTRGRRIIAMAARIGLVVANVGNVTTFRRPGCEGTIPDITLVNERMRHKVRAWKVLEIYTASDHQYISYKLMTNRSLPHHVTSQGTCMWNANKLDTAALINELDRIAGNTEVTGAARDIVRQTMNIVRMGCDKAMPRQRRGNANRKPVYWWNEEIDELRRNCLRLRRVYTRANRRGTAEEERTQYKRARKELRKAIASSKKRQWEELRADINRNPWGLGYKVVMKKLGMKNPTVEMDANIMENIVESLFPRHDIREDDVEVDTGTALEFTVDELKAAAQCLKNKKAPGPDGIPAEVLKVIATERPELLLRMYNSCLRDGVFPEPWKEQRLVLISKGNGDPQSPSSYRPLCMLDTAGKLLERLLKPRLEEAIIRGGGLSERQYGFRPGMSTIGALKIVADAFAEAQRRNPASRPVVLLATLDIKNAFNSLRWTNVLLALERNFAVPKYLMRMIRSYLKERFLIYNTREGPKRTEITSGAAQGSILGPILWNASYDGILRVEMPESTCLVGYADDVAAVIKARNTDEAQRKLRQVLMRTKAWLDSHGLQLAMHKTELIFLTRRHIPTEMDFHFGNVVLPTRRVVKYLGIRFDNKMTFSSQIQYATEKAARITVQLSRLMANVGGPLPGKRRLLMEACNSILLYGSEVWAETLDTESRAKRLLAVQRIAALRVSSAYRTVSSAAVLVIAGMPPIHLQAKERMNVWHATHNPTPETPAVEEIKEETMTRWQHCWNNERNGRWTYKLIPDIRKWIGRTAGEVNYYLTQMLSGHGYFRKYLHKIGKCSSPFCMYEEEQVLDDADHTFFKCRRWRSMAIDLEAQIGAVSPENIIDKMTDNEANWNAVAKFVEVLLRKKKKDLDRPP